MSRKTVPLLAAAVFLLFAALLVIIAFLLSDPLRRDARLSRQEANSALLDNGGALDLISMRLSSPLSSDGSLSNLFHYLSKDPGRSRFPRAGDRRRQERYLSGELLVSSKTTAEILKNENLPIWAPRFTGDVTALFDELERNLAALLGIPAEIAREGFPQSSAPSITGQTISAIGDFGEKWIPSGETKRRYSRDRAIIRARLVNDRRFLKRMEEQDIAWRQLAASLYLLAINEHWRIAVEYNPQLSGRLRELTVLFVTADLRRRTSDLMAKVIEDKSLFDTTSHPGIFWIPQMIYYKNVPEITGQTRDEVSTIYIAKVNLGYTVGDRQTQDWLNRRKDYLTDYFKSYFSNRVMEDFSPITPSEQKLSLWRTARLKAEALYGINLRMNSSFPFGSKGPYGLQDLAFVRVNLLENP